MEDKTETATFAGGCFWCMEHPFDQLKGVLSVQVGYTGGKTENPTYEEVCTGKTGHTEAVKIVFDPAQISYQTLLDVFWHNIDPTTKNQQFCDIGTQYRTAIFTHSEGQKAIAEGSRNELKMNVVTEIVPAGRFYPAEDYHQQYYQKNPTHYQFYRWGSGREKGLKQIWKNN